MDDESKPEHPVFDREVPTPEKWADEEYCSMFNAVLLLYKKLEIVFLSFSGMLETTK